MGTIDLIGAELDREIAKPGVLLIHWWAPESLASDFSSAAYESAALRNPQTRFASVNAASEESLAREYQVSSVPTLMVFREGILVFAGAGPFTGEQVEQLLVAVEALDMEEVRRTRNGHSRTAPILAALPPPVVTAPPGAASPKPLK